MVPPGGYPGCPASVSTQPEVYFSFKNIERHTAVLEDFGMKFADVETRSQDLVRPAAQRRNLEFTHRAGQRIPRQRHEAVHHQIRVRRARRQLVTPIVRRSGEGPIYGMQARIDDQRGRASQLTQKHPPSGFIVTVQTQLLAQCCGIQSPSVVEGWVGAETSKLRQVGPFLLERGLKVASRYRFLQKTCNVEIRGTGSTRCGVHIEDGGSPAHWCGALIGGKRRRPGGGEYGTKLEICARHGGE